METRNCQNCKNDFTIEAEDFKFYEKMKVPPPTFCPDCRFQRRLAFRNNRVFYRRECGLCQKSMLSIYSKNKPYTIFCKECWLSDKWNPLDYGQEYDFTKDFFAQFKELQIKVPRANLYQTNFINSEYCNYGLDLKDCYLLFGGINNERVSFSNQVFDSRDSLDICFSNKIEFSYDLFECKNTNKLFFSQNCIDCIDSSYLVDCRNCSSCFGCVGLINKKYYIFNQPYSKAEYEKFIQENQGSFQKHIENLSKLQALKQTLPVRFARVYKSVNSDGDDLSEARNSHSCFSSSEVEDSKYLFFCNRGSRYCYDASFLGFNSEMIYEVAHGFGGNNSCFGMRNFSNQDSQYNEECHNCLNVFGCEGLRKKQYCILNKQYSKEEYEKILPQILEQMKEVPYVDRMGRVYKYGEFFPIEISPFAYNESIAQEYFPLDKEGALSLGFDWVDGEERNYKIDLNTADIPDSISDVDESIVGKVIACEHSGGCKDQCTEAFKILPEEFKFYKRMNLPIPRLCPNCRHYQKIGLRNPIHLWERACMCDKQNHFHGDSKCAVEFKTTYSPDRGDIIYCEKCYQQEIY